MADRKTELVHATRDFSNAAIGSKSRNEEFQYDLDGDPEKLGKLGLVKKGAAPKDDSAPPAAAADKPGK